MIRNLTAFLLLAVTCAHSLFSQSADETASILKRLDQLEKQNAELLAEIKALRESLPKPAEVATVTSAETAAERQEVTEHRVEELNQTKVEASQRFPIQLTGTVLFNAFLNGTNGAGNQDPVTAALAAGPRESGASFRQTVLGLNYNGPQTFFGGTISGSLYMDFFGGSTASLNHLVRLRLATIQLDWPGTTLTVGQDKPLVSRREPNSLAQVGVSPLTDAGNPWLWQPQARLEQRFTLASRTELKAEAGIFQTSEGTNPALPIPSGLKIESSRPAFQARLSVKQTFADNRSIEIASVFHTSTSHIAGASVPSRLYGVDWLIKPASKFEITGLLFRGENYANLDALAGFTVSSSGIVIPVHGTGGWSQFRYLATTKLSFNLYGGQEDNRNIDLYSGQIGKNQYYAGNAMFLLAPNVVAAFEFGQNRTTYLGLGNRLNNHYDLALAYLF